MTSEPLDYHEQHAGEIIPDPWEDSQQTDWPNRKIEEVMSSDQPVGAHERPDELSEQG